MLNEVAKQIVDIFKKDKKYFENVKWCAFYSKYNEEKLCYKDGWNFPVSDLVSKELTENRAVNAEKLEPFYDWLGERIALCLNLQNGKTNEELKELLAEAQ